MITIRRLLSNLLLFITMFMLAGCKLDILNPKGTIAAGERTLLINATLLMLIVVIPVILLNFWFAWRYRASNKAATYKPDEHHNTMIEAVCWLIPIIIIGILAVMTWISTHQLDPYRPLDKPGKPLTIQAIALNWKWLFIYPEENIASVNYMQIPLHRQVKLLITADAPMNSLEIPQLAGQIYAMGGMQTKLHFDANAIGTYRGLSTNYSGDGFAGMHFKVQATSARDYQAWVRDIKTSPMALTKTVYAQLAKDSENNPVTYYSSVSKHLFQDVIHQFMKPGNSMLSRTGNPNR